MNPFELFY